MKKSRFSEEQIVGVLKEAEAGVPAGEICRRLGVSGVTFYRWKAKYGGLEVSEAKRLRAPFLRMAGSWQVKQDLQGVSGGSFSILGWSRFTTVQAVQHQLHPAGDPEFFKHTKQVIFHRVLS